MGEPEQTDGLPDAAGRRAAGRLAARPGLRGFAPNQAGATAVEYGLVAAGISVAIIAVVQGLGSKLSATFVQDAFK